MSRRASWSHQRVRDGRYLVLVTRPVRGGPHEGATPAVTLWSATRDGAPHLLDRPLTPNELIEVAAVVRGPFCRPAPREASALAARREATASLSLRRRSGLHRFDA